MGGGGWRGGGEGYDYNPGLIMASFAVHVIFYTIRHNYTDTHSASY